ncbi:hypothetical protein ILYODFUR_017112 [Ilyodon furcidens]|uniref:Uncharacterized protein n=1 Tax=Ilyodon furcidens TaxID=33524 RepID=A0ABV0UH17_9TELE
MKLQPARGKKTQCIFLTCCNYPVSWPEVIFSTEQRQICLKGTKSDTAKEVRPFQAQNSQQIHPFLTSYPEISNANPSLASDVSLKPSFTQMRMDADTHAHHNSFFNNILSIPQ